MSDRTETDRALLPATQDIMVLRLVFSAGQLVSDQQWPLVPGTLFLGRASDSEAGVALPNDRRASSVHAKISVGAAGIRITDEGSKNYTFVNGQKVEESALADGDLIRVGDSLLLICNEPAQVRDVVGPNAEIRSFILGSAAATRRFRCQLAEAAEQPHAVLLLGESGTGKELAARALHMLSSRRKNKLIKVNVAALSQSLFESELFGHAAGAFTGAREARSGRFHEAEGGTLFLDEIGELSMDLQPKLLSVIEDQKFRPIGGRADQPCDVRVIAATNRDLDTAVRAGQFRLDLQQRLARRVIRLPPLRERPEDILPLFLHYLQLPPEQLSHVLSARLCEALMLYSWPGNIRELQNVCTMVQTSFDPTGGFQLQVILNRLAPSPPVIPLVEPRAAFARKRTEQYNAETLARLLKEREGNISQLSELTQLSRRTLKRLLIRFGIDYETYRKKKK